MASVVKTDPGFKYFCYFYLNIKALFFTNLNIKMEDNQVLAHIKNLSAKEEDLYGKENLTDEDIKKLHAMQVELDQCWDFLRQRRALRDAGKNPDKAEVRPPDIVENYEE